MKNARTRNTRWCCIDLFKFFKCFHRGFKHMWMHEINVSMILGVEIWKYFSFCIWSEVHKKCFIILLLLKRIYFLWKRLGNSFLIVLTSSNHISYNMNSATYVVWLDTPIGFVIFGNLNSASAITCVWCGLYIHYYKTWFFKWFKLTNWYFLLIDMSILTRSSKHVFFYQSIWLKWLIWPIHLVKLNNPSQNGQWVLVKWDIWSNLNIRIWHH
jgi:hypothetical protein